MSPSFLISANIPINSNLSTSSHVGSGAGLWYAPSPLLKIDIFGNSLLRYCSSCDTLCAFCILCTQSGPVNTLALPPSPPAPSEFLLLPFPSPKIDGTSLSSCWWCVASCATSEDERKYLFNPCSASLSRRKLEKRLSQSRIVLPLDNFFNCPTLRRHPTL